MKLCHAAVLMIAAAILMGCGDAASSTPAPQATGEQPAAVPSAPGGAGGGNLNASSPDPSVGYNPNASSGVQVGDKAGGK